MIYKEISLFKGYADTCPTSVQLTELIRLIRESPHVRDHTEKHRYFLSQGNLSAARREKATSPCFAVAVQFEGGKQQRHISGWTGLCLVDIDHLEDDQLETCRVRACADPHTLLAYATIGGHGLRILFPISGLGANNRQNLRIYHQAFEQGNRYYAELLGCTCDLQCKNATRLSGLAYDPNVFFNPDAQPLVPELPPTAAPKKTKKAAASRLLTKAVKAARKILDSEQVVYEPGRHNEYVMRMGYLLNEFGVPLDEAVRWGTDTFTDYDGDVAGIFTSCYRHTEEHGTRKPDARGKGNASCDVKTIEAFLSTQARFRHNEITGQCEIAYIDPKTGDAPAAYQRLTDRDVNTLWRRISMEVGNTRLRDIHSVLHSEYVPSYNPLREYLLNLPPWDGTDYIAQLAATVHVKGSQKRFTEYFRKWFVGILPPIFEEQTVNHEILVLVGKQGSYKTTWFNYLLPPELRAYFHTKVSNNYNGKDDLFSLTEFMLICLEEIDEMSPLALNQLKAMVTLKSVNERPAYGHNKEYRPHIASFCATGNNVNFLNDPSGNRRWLPFEVDHIDPPQEHPINYAGLYAQAYHLWKENFRYWFSNAELRALNKYNRNFEAPNLELELIKNHFRQTRPNEVGTFVTIADVLQLINGGLRHSLSPQKIGLLMKQMDFEAIRYKGQRGYRVVVFNGEEIKHNRHLAAYETLHNPEPETEVVQDKIPENEENTGYKADECQLPF